MKNNKLENLTSQKLKKKYKLGSILFYVLLVVGILNISITIYLFIMGNDFNFSLLGTAIGCLAIALPIYLGKKNVFEELQRRDNLG